MNAFKVTAKQSIAGKIAKGMSVQVASNNSSMPLYKEIAEAFKRQLGIEVLSSNLSNSYFTVERLK